MNIFVLDENPHRAARYMCDKHVPKMVLETAQLLSTACHVLDKDNKYGIHGNIYKPTHKNHPCSVWVRECKENYFWTFRHFVALSIEYTLRFGKTHKSSALVDILALYPCEFSEDAVYKSIERSRTPFAQAMPEQYKVPGDAVSAYRAYYIGEKSKFAKWEKPNARVPDWWPSS